MLKVEENDQVSAQKLANFPINDMELIGPSMCLVNDKFIYQTGGSYIDASRETCHRYDIEKDLWQELKKLNHSRIAHSSCHLGGHIYVF